MSLLMFVDFVECSFLHGVQQETRRARTHSLPGIKREYGLRTTSFQGTFEELEVHELVLGRFNLGQK